MTDLRPTPGDYFTAPGHDGALTIATVHLGVLDTLPWHVVTATNGARFAIWAVASDDGVRWAGEHFDWLDRRADER